MRSQKGIAALGVVLLLVVVIVVIAAGYLVLRTREPQPVITEDTASTVPNGTVDNAVNATNQQIQDELENEENALTSEDKEVDLDGGVFSDLEGAVNESNL